MRATRAPIPVIIAACLIVILGGCGPKAGPTATPTPTSIPLGPLPKSLILPAGSAAPFAIEGNVLAWSGIPNPTGVCPRNHVYLANVRAFRPRTIWRGGQCAVVSDVRISSRWVVWAAGVSPSGSVWGERRGRHRVFRIGGQTRQLSATEPCPTAGCFPNLGFSLTGNVAVWSETTFGATGDEMDSAILGRNLPRGRSKTLYSTAGPCRAQSSPFIAGNRLVWLQITWPLDAQVQPGLNQCRGNESMNVATEELGSVFAPGRRSRGPFNPVVITSSGLASNPQTDGRYVSWQDTLGVSPGCLCYDLDLYDTRTNQVVTVARSIEDYVLSGHLLAWIQLTPHGERVQAAIIPAGRLRVAHIRTVATSGAPASHRFIRTFGWPSDRRLIWELDSLKGTTYRVRVVLRDIR